MKRARNTESSEALKNRRAAISPEMRENQVIAAAFDLVETRILNGTASSQETTHFLKLASDKEKKGLELEILKAKKELMDAQTRALKAQEDSQRMLEEAIAAMKEYSGNSRGDDEDEYD